MKLFKREGKAGCEVDEQNEWVLQRKDTSGAEIKNTDVDFVRSSLFMAGQYKSRSDDYRSGFFLWRPSLLRSVCLKLNWNIPLRLNVIYTCEANTMASCLTTTSPQTSNLVSSWIQPFRVGDTRSWTWPTKEQAQRNFFQPVHILKNFTFLRNVLTGSMFECLNLMLG